MVTRETILIDDGCNKCIEPKLICDASMSENTMEDESEDMEDESEDTMEDELYIGESAPKRKRAASIMEREEASEPQHREKIQHVGTTAPLSEAAQAFLSRMKD